MKGGCRLEFVLDGDFGGAVHCSQCGGGASMVGGYCSRPAKPQDR